MNQGEKPTVIVNDLASLRRRSGVGFYVSELLVALRDSGAANVIPLSKTIAGRPLRFASKLLAESKRAKPETPGSTEPSWMKSRISRAKATGLRWADRYVEIAAKLFRWPLFHETDHCPANLETPVVTTVHDLSVILHPEWHPAHRVKKYEEKFARGLERSRRIITDSDAVRREVIATFGIAPEKVVTAPLAPRRRFRPVDPAQAAAARRRFGLPEKFVLFVGTVEPRKNVSTLLDAYALLAPDLRRRHPLVIVGGWGWKSDEVRERLTKAPWSECVRRLGYVSESDLHLLLNAAAVLAYPSLYEGFGLPPVEAMACGTPVVTTHGGGLKDAVGDAACIVDPHDPKGLAAALAQILADAEWADEIMWRGYRRAAELSWRETARITIETYRNAA